MLRIIKFLKFKILGIPNLGTSGFWKFQILKILDFGNSRFWKYWISEIEDFENTWSGKFLNFLDFFRKFSTCNQKFFIKNSRKYFAVKIFFHANRQISVRSLQKHTFFPQPKILVCEKILEETSSKNFQDWLFSCVFLGINFLFLVFLFTSRS